MHWQDDDVNDNDNSDNGTNSMAQSPHGRAVYARTAERRGQCHAKRE